MIIKCTQCKQDTTVNDSIASWVTELVCTKCIISGVRTNVRTGDLNSHSSPSVCSNEHTTNNNQSTFDNNESSY